MSSTTTAKQPPSSPSSRGRKGNRGRRESAGKSRSTARQTPSTKDGDHSTQDDSKPALTPAPSTENNDPSAPSTSLITETADLNDAVCWICAEPVKYYALSECDHRTCHVCTLRLRALYKKMNCTFCKLQQSSVIFTVSPHASFSDFTPDHIPYKDSKLSIFFETEDMREETFVLLRYNCPEPSCDYIATGWSDLKLHARAVHLKLMCDLCIRSKKVFSHEHTLYSSAQLAVHLPSMPFRMRRPIQKDQKEIPEGGVHPLCEFCRECFFGDDELFSHMRQNHEECFLCKRNNIKDQYFSNYECLEKHFHDAHHPCVQPQCLGQKFVVFDSPIDLKAHMVEQHVSGMSSRDKKDARKIQADFEFEGMSLGGREGRFRREREREASSQQHSTGIAKLNTTSRRMEGFGASLTTESNGNASSSNDLSTGERLFSLSARLQSLAVNSSNALRAIEAAIRSYVSSESSARDLISTIWNISDRKLEDTASAVNAILDVLDDEDKRRNLLSSWNGFKIEERRQFPDLIPSGIGTGYAEITSGRVLNAKNLTSPRVSRQSSRQVWDRVARAASSSPDLAPRPKQPDLFPPLQPLASSSASGPGPTPVFHHQGQRKTPWTSSSASSGVRGPPPIATVPISSSPETRSGGSANVGQQQRRQATRPKFSDAAFPELPSSSTARPKPHTGMVGNSSLRNIMGDTAPAKSVWATGGGIDDIQNVVSTEGEREEEREPGKGKKGKGKQKQMLFTLGTFPT